LLEIRECADPRLVVPANPPVGDGVDRLGIQVVQLLPAVPHGGDQVRLFQDRQVLADRLPGHIEPGAQLAQRLPGPLVQAVEQPPAAGVSQRPEHLIHRKIVPSSHRNAAI